MTQTFPLPITGLILAGGAARRMGGQDKGWLRWRDRPLIDTALAHLDGKLAEVLISANRHLDAYAALGARVITDETSGFKGPLQGLVRGLREARHDWLLSLPVDTPRLPPDLVERLWNHPGASPLRVARTPSGAQPLVCLCHRSLLPPLQDYLAAGGRRAQAWFADLPHQWVDFDEADFFNCNTPEDLCT